jgi:DNA-binding SARP family transcriptional activator
VGPGSYGSPVLAWPRLDFNAVGAGARSPSIEFRVLGPVSAEVDGVRVVLGGPKPQAVFAMLVLRPGNTVSTDRLLLGLWDDPPTRSLATLQVYISGLRKALGAVGLESVLVSRSNGYSLDVAGPSVDAVRFEALVATADEAIRRGAAHEALEAADAALAEVRGQPLSGVEGAPFAMAEASRFREMVSAIQERRFELLLGLGRSVDAVPGLERAALSDPTRESTAALLALALYRTGRQVDALKAIRRCRDHLVEELGLDLGQELSSLEQRVLEQHPSLLEVDSRDAPAPDNAATVQAGPPLRAALHGSDGRRYELTARTTIGRQRTNDIVLVDPSSSRQHAEVRRALEHWLLIDLGSANGTFVNGERGEHWQLAEGDVITIGSFSLEFKSA